LSTPNKKNSGKCELIEKPDELFDIHNVTASDVLEGITTDGTRLLLTRSGLIHLDAPLEVGVR
jgi:hypothetical protein